MKPTGQSPEIPAQYDAGATERALYEAWEKGGVFTAHADRSARVGGDRDPFVVVMPPPNVTAVLHMGHGLNNTVQDVIIRWRRMVGDEALWVPGTDHAGIATQNIIEKQLAAEGKTKFDLGREAFVARTVAFVEETGGKILRQQRAIGASADWNRTAYTFSPELSRGVREAFVQLYERGLIYRGHRVIHWCPRCMTSLSDEEAEHDEEMGRLYQIAYPVVGAKSNASLIVATTRPETMLGDVAVAVHPDDERYKKLIGKSVTLPIANVEIPVIADDYVDPAFGTGVVKITPAHDPNDFEVGKRHKLPMPVIMAPDGTMANGVDANARVPAELLGIDRFEARERIIRTLETSRQLIKVESHQPAVRHCYRCDTVVEPRLSDQWFVKMRPLAEPVLKAYRDKKLRIVPERWHATFEHWMENIRDWNISRQLWWGHRIPVFTCTRCKHTWADREDPKTCPKCKGPVEQDPDVLDTWFSSWLWPFAPFGWPEKTPDLARFYPGHTLVTAPDILFFWVARMLMAGYHFMDRRLPFTTVYLTGTVRDTQHRKMSKSLGNGIDPRDVARLYGADALRWTLIGGGSLGADVIVDPNDLETTFAPGRNFANKLWNIGQFVLGQLPTALPAIESIDRRSLTLADRWILSRAQAMIRETTTSLEQFRLDEAAKRCYEFAWNELADWYVEAVKPRLTGAAPTEAAQ